MKSLSEAARLYLADADVLEEARGQLDEYFGAAWEAMIADVPLPAAGKGAFERPGRAWTCWNSTGTGRCLYLDTTPSTFIKLGVCDPFRSEEGRAFEVFLWCNKSTKKDLEANPGARAAFDQAATTRSLPKTDLADVDMLWGETIAVHPHDAEHTGRDVADAVRRYFAHADALNAVLAGVLKSSPEGV